MKLEKLRRKNNNKGFTLIEMVIVITIIGLLTSVAVTKYDKVQKNAKENADYATAANLATAATIALSDGESSVEPVSLLSNGYIQFVPKPKSVTGVFKITPSAEKDSVTVTAGGKDFYPKPEANLDSDNRE